MLENTGLRWPQCPPENFLREARFQKRQPDMETPHSWEDEVVSVCLPGYGRSPHFSTELLGR